MKNLLNTILMAAVIMVSLPVFAQTQTVVIKDEYPHDALFAARTAKKEAREAIGVVTKGISALSVRVRNQMGQDKLNELRSSFSQVSTKLNNLVADSAYNSNGSKWGEAEFEIEQFELQLNNFLEMTDFSVRGDKSMITTLVQDMKKAFGKAKAEVKKAQF